MVRSPFDKIAFLYDFIETHILKDYQGSFELITEYLPMDNTGKLIDIGGGTGYFSEMLISARSFRCLLFSMVFAFSR